MFIISNNMFKEVYCRIILDSIHYLRAFASFFSLQGCEFCTKSLQSVLNANLLIFKTVVAGDSWGDVAVPLIEADPWMATVIFIGSHLTIVFGVLNLVVAAAPSDDHDSVNESSTTPILLDCF